MKVYTGLLALVLISALVLPGTEAGWFRRVVSRVKAVFCSTVVSRVCNRNGVCSWINKRVCSKRDLDSMNINLRDVNDNEEDDRHLTGIPVSFDFYDMDDDDLICIKELAKALNMDEQETKEKAIGICDKNGDKALSEEEFETCSFVFEDRELDSGEKPQFVAKQRKRRNRNQKN